PSCPSSGCACSSSPPAPTCNARWRDLRPDCMTPRQATWMARGLLAMLLAGLAACQAHPPMSGAVHWYRNSAELKAIFEQTFEVAARELRARSTGMAPGTWAVILDVDETLLDNSGYVVEFGRY